LFIGADGGNTYADTSHAAARPERLMIKVHDRRETRGPAPPSGFPLWGSLAIPAGFLWGALLGAAVGAWLGNLFIGAMIGAGLGLGIGLTLFAAAIVVVSAKL
jgi:hypothetical protein